jgi:GNAT superfamily N-acetyltransferase
MAVRENVLSSPARITTADYQVSLEVKGRGWVIDNGGEIIAFAIGHETDGNIWALFVDPAHEGRGHGRLLHDVMVGWLRDRGLDQLWLTTDHDSRAAGFYRACGWRYVGPEPSGEARFELDLDRAITRT